MDKGKTAGEYEDLCKACGLREGETTKQVWDFLPQLFSGGNRGGLVQIIAVRMITAYGNALRNRERDL